MPFLKTEKELWDKIILINLYGPLNTHKAIAPLMAERGGGRIVNIASDAAQRRLPGPDEHADDGGGAWRRRARGQVEGCHGQGYPAQANG
jgi:NAD(P)-dependent dehydrogenase (short-subunit alcohol dehydrogenase family)